MNLKNLHFAKIYEKSTKIALIEDLKLKRMKDEARHKLSQLARVEEHAVLLSGSFLFRVKI